MSLSQISEGRIEGDKLQEVWLQALDMGEKKRVCSIGPRNVNKATFLKEKLSARSDDEEDMEVS